MLSHFHNFAKSQNFLIGASLVRISIALLLLYHYLIHYFQRYFLWSDSGVNVYEPKEAAFSLYNFNNSLAYFDLIYHLGIIVTIIYLLGYKGRIISIINYIFYFSLYNRTVHISDGGDNLLIICMLFLLFANTTAYFSLDAKKHQERLKANKTSFFKDISMIFHNFAVLACIIQLCVVYFFSGGSFK
ncbi:thioredoxin [Gracilibacillus boraciitolerans JCM 21714]|uniref:Thioredoxin n=1 Tax=Gracilibacillus boraciitolerans JCM 21714 TaxID=1298598 RepID=W4VQ04_9BACI|nr:thioredoxin [Gracilibacillus boraciitolerans JCM 21714]